MIWGYSYLKETPTYTNVYWVGSTKTTLCILVQTVMTLLNLMSSRVCKVDRYCGMHCNCRRIHWYTWPCSNISCYFSIFLVSWYITGIVMCNHVIIYVYNIHIHTYAIVASLMFGHTQRLYIHDFQIYPHAPCRLSIPGP